MYRTWVVSLVTVVHGKELCIRNRERLANGVSRIGLLRSPWLTHKCKLDSRSPTDTEQLPTLATPGSIGVIDSPLGGIWQEKHRNMLTVTPTGGSVGTTTRQVQQVIQIHHEPQFCNKLACSTSALALSDRYPTLHLNGFTCLHSAQYTPRNTQTKNLT